MAKPGSLPVYQQVAELLILRREFPRSLAFCVSGLVEYLSYLAEDYGDRRPSLALAEALNARLKDRDIGTIFDEGLHEFLGSVLNEIARLGQQIEQDYRFSK